MCGLYSACHVCVCVCVCVCGVWNKPRTGRSLKKYFVVVGLKNIRCDHVLFGERYNSHGKADIELNLTNLLNFKCCRNNFQCIAHIFIAGLQCSVYRPMQTKYSLVVTYLARAWPGPREM